MKKRILIIDDDPEIRSILQRILAQAGFEVLTVASGEEGTRVFRQSPADLVIVDMVMPDKDGLETLMEIRRGFPSARVVAMSGAPRADVMDPLSVALKLGAVASLSKPFNPKDLVHFVRATLPGPKLQQAA